MSLAGNSFGHSFRVTSFGESHGAAVGCVIDGCPAGMPLAETDLQPDLDRRRPGQGPLASTRQEPDEVRILSGVHDGKTLGTPIALLIGNLDARPKAYASMAGIYRPSHADYTYQAKYGYPPLPGGGRASARETAARVAAGAVARKLLAQAEGVEIVAWVAQVAHLVAAVDPDTVTRQSVAAQGAVQCPDCAVASQMTSLIEAVRADGDTVGGVIGAVARGVPAGLGDPVFDKLEATLAAAMLSLPAAKGFENGSGFGGLSLRGSEHNDAFVPGPDGRIRTRTNRSGGIQGGISNGMPIVLRVAFKPVATHFKPQDTVNLQGEPVSFSAQGRHDPCVLPRAVVIVEAMLALCLADAWLRQRAQKV